MKSHLVGFVLTTIVFLCLSIPFVHAKGNVVTWSSPVTEDLWSVFMVDENDGWAVGGGNSILHWDGTDWSLEVSGLNSLRSVSMVNKTYGWAVGFLGERWLWNGTEWTDHSFPSSYLYYYDVSMVSSEDGWAVGIGGDMIRWHPGEWYDYPPQTGANLHSVFMLNESDGWAVGMAGTILHWDGSSWDSVSSPTGGDLYSVYMISPSDGWAVGTTVIHWDGSEWSLVDHPPVGYNPCSSVFMLDEDDVWIVRGSDMWHWNGTAIEQIATPSTKILHSLHMVGPNDGWAVGEDGTIIRWTGTEWIPEFSHTIVAFLTLIILTVTVFFKRNGIRKDKTKRICN